jgi:hypothetical protein
MNLKKTAVILTSIVTVLIAQNVLAGSGALKLIKSKTTIQQVISATQKAKLTHISSIEFDDGYWQIKTLKNKIETKYIFDSKTSKITKLGTEHENDMPPPKTIDTIQKAIKTLIKKHPKYIIKSISYESSLWEISAYDETIMENEISLNKNGSKVLFTKIDD